METRSDMVIKNALIVDSKGEREADIEIKDGKIAKIGTDLSSDEIYDAKGCSVLPGIVELNAKTCDDRVSVDSLAKLAKNSAKGGVTTVLLNPHLNPKIDDEIILEFVKSQNELNSKSDIKPMITAIKGEENEQLSEIAILLKKGAAAIYTSSDIDSSLMRRVFEYAVMYEIPLHCRAQNCSLRAGGVMHEGEVSSELGLGGIPELEENIEVAKIVEFLNRYRIETVFKSLSSARSVELVNEAKKRGFKAYAEVSIHHLVKSDEACRGYNTCAKIDPPLRDRENRELLLQMLKNGQIDFLTSLHSPKSMVQKDIAFDEAAYGVDAISLYLPIAYTYLVKSGILNMSDLTKLLCKNPAKVLGLNHGTIEEGCSADIVIFDPDKKRVVENEESLYYKEELFGEVTATFKEGRRIF
ncbi:amidohydrolase family protein [Nitrosophilus alvini]|uniref:amidohydrolase family protein n=1 Tax=Nitrosophilus alvini TaxID=2714855 RepID=UPI002279047D|nr:amidohydrolase family protein [Nitrosophilus alvini]